MEVLAFSLGCRTLPIIDGGPGYDSGLSRHSPSTAPVTFGFLNFGFCDTGAYLLTEVVELQRNSANFAVTSGVSSSRRALSGSPTGIPADSIQIDYSLSPHATRGQRF